MNKAYVDGAAKAAMFLAMIFALASQTVAQTWQSPGKTAVIPVVVANTTCNSSTDTVGITADRSMLLTCQSGRWQANSFSANSCAYKTLTAGLPGQSCSSTVGQSLIYAGGDGSGPIITSPSDDGSRGWSSIIGYVPASSDEGAINTPKIVAKQNSIYSNGLAVTAAGLCALKGTGWALPSLRQLQVLYDNRAEIGGFVAGVYWASQDVGSSSPDAALAFHFGTGISTQGYKMSMGYVRCVRRD